MSKWFLDSERRLRTFWRLAIFCVGYVIGVLLFSIACGLAVYLVGAGVGKGREVVDWLQGDLAMVGAAFAPPTTLFTIGYVWIFRRYIDRRDLASLGMRRPERRWTASVWAGLALGIVPLATLTGILIAAGELTGSIHSISGTVLFLLCTLPFAAFTEELVARGYVLQNLVEVRRPILGVIISSVLFWLFHSINPGAWATPIISVNLFLAGILLALAYLLSGNIWFPTALHFGWNACQGPIFGLPISGVDIGGWIDLQPVSNASVLLTGGPFGLEGSLSATVLEVVLIAVLATLLYRRRHENSKPADSNGEDMP